MLVSSFQMCNIVIKTFSVKDKVVSARWQLDAVYLTFELTVKVSYSHTTCLNNFTHTGFKDVSLA